MGNFKLIQISEEDDKLLMNDIKEIIVRDNPQLKRLHFTRKMLVHEVIDYVRKFKGIYR